MNTAQLGPMVDDIKESEKKAFALRLHLAAKAHGLSDYGKQSAIARFAGVSPRAARKWFDGDSMPNVAHGAMIARGLNVSFNWLMSNQGPMMEAVKMDMEGAAIAIAWPAISDEIKDLVRQILDHAISPVNPGRELWEDQKRKRPAKPGGAVDQRKDH